MEHGAEVVRVANDDDHVVGIVLDLKRITFWDMGKRGCATYGRNGVVWVEKSKTPKTRIKLRDMGKRGVRHMGEMLGETGDVASGVNGYIRLASLSTYTR